MAIPINIRKIFAERGWDNELSEEFLIESYESGVKWRATYQADRKELTRLRNELNDLLGFSDVSKTLDISIEQAEEVLNYHSSNEICEGCDFKMIECKECIFTCQSPLEQALFLELKRNSFEPVLQRRISKDGSHYDDPTPVIPETILTIPDFYLEADNKKVCVYADGHTYHERTEYQAKRDRSIDRELQKLGFVVLRFTGKEIREEIDQVLDSIKASMNT